MGRAKFSDFEGMMSHFSKRCVAGETEELCAISMVPSPLPNSNSLKQLRVHSTTFTCAPRTWYCTFGIHIPSIPPVCTSKVPHFIPFLSLLDAKDALTMIASFMKQIIFRGQFRVAWGTVCHQDACATMLVGREHTFQSTSGTNTWRAVRWRLSRLGSCCDVTWTFLPHPTQPPTTDEAAA